MRMTNHYKILVLGIICLAASVVKSNAVQNDPYFFTIQIASFQQRQLAMDAAQKLKTARQDAFFRSKQVDDKGTWYRLYLNRYTSMQAALAGLKKLRQQGIITDAYVRRIPKMTGENGQSNKKSKAAPTVQTGPQLRPASPLVTQQIQAVGEPILRSNRSNRDSGGIIVKNIAYQIDENKRDAALIYADGYFWPAVHLDRKDDGSRLVVSVDKVKQFEKKASAIQTNGRYIKAGAIQYKAAKQTIILDLELPAPDSYTITQSFNKAENVFKLVFSEE